MTQAHPRPMRVAPLLALALAVPQAANAQDPVPVAEDSADAAVAAPDPADAAARAPAFQMVRGFVTTADRRPARGLLARVKTSAGEQVSEINADGSFLVIAPAGDGDVEVVVDAADPAKRWYYPSWVSLPASHAGREQGFVLVPRVWQIPQGRYGEQWVEMNLDKAFEWVAPTMRHAFFQWQINDGVEAEARDRPNSWGLESLPIAVAFDRDSSAVLIEDVDSLKFWSALASMEEDFGLDLFRPTRAEQIPADGPEADRVIRVWVPDSLPGALGMASNTREEGRMRRGWVKIDRRRFLRDHVLVKHEFMHALGFGHTCSWPTVVSGPNCRRITLDVASQFDVAHAQLTFNVNALQRRTGARNGIVAAWNGQKRVMEAQVTSAGR